MTLGLSNAIVTVALVRCFIIAKLHHCQCHRCDHEWMTIHDECIVFDHHWIAIALECMPLHCQCQRIDHECIEIDHEWIAIKRECISLHCQCHRCDHESISFFSLCNLNPPGDVSRCIPVGTLKTVNMHPGNHYADAKHQSSPLASNPQSRHRCPQRV